MTKMYQSFTLIVAMVIVACLINVVKVPSKEHHEDVNFFDYYYPRNYQLRFGGFPHFYSYRVHNPYAYWYV